ncbi:MAG: hypothetical protein K0R54_249 [Clostridiaceae bacterium]|jgi:hypothetical protein|nr:hypothetical protein [Clostridiaceae bacterium]
MKSIRTIDVHEMDREVAILVYKNKIYEDANHQYALEIALSENGKCLEINLEKDLDKAIDLTYDMSKNNEIYAFDLYNDGINPMYLISHFKSNLEACYELIREYALKHNYTLGSFGESMGKYCEIYI